MLGSKKEKEISKADMEKKVQAWKTINEVLIQTNSNFMQALINKLTEKKVQLSQLEEKLKSENASEDDNAEYIFTGGYIKCLEDILSTKRND